MKPTGRLVSILLLWAVLGCAAGYFSALTAVWYAVGIALCAWAGADAWRAWQPLPVTIERPIPNVWPVQVLHAASLSVHHHGTRALRMSIWDDHPTDWEMQGLPHSTRLMPGTCTTITYQLRPNARGHANFGAAHLQVISPSGLWQRVHRIGPSTSVKVFPDFSRLLGHSLHATDRRIRSSGILRQRQRGEGTDFRHLREYRDGDSVRSIDWKATARQQKPIVREYQEERDQQIVFLLDTGRRMLAQDSTGAHFDHALNAVLTVGFLAQKQGDAVGLMSFGNDSQDQYRWIAPHKGRIGLDRLITGTYDLQPSENTPDYIQAASALSQHLSKRALVIIITNLRDEDDQAMQTACALLSRQHMVLCASLRETALDAAIAAPVQQLSDALRSAAATLYMEQRQKAIQRLGLRAHNLLDTSPPQLAMALVNRYMDIKHSGRL